MVTGTLIVELDKWSTLGSGNGSSLFTKKNRTLQDFALADKNVQERAGLLNIFFS